MNKLEIWMKEVADTLEILDKRLTQVEHDAFCEDSE